MLTDAPLWKSENCALWHAYFDGYNDALEMKSKTGKKFDESLWNKIVPKVRERPIMFLKKKETDNA